MARWEPNARGRLRDAAMDLYAERGYEQTTVADIAERAGLTARTFFRHFADKREVLFGGSLQLEELMVAAAEAVPADAPPMRAVIAALEATAEPLGQDQPHSRRRQALITATPELQERELIKLATLSAALGAALRRRGVPEPEASLAAETGIAVFRVAWERWLDAGEERPLADVIREAVGRFETLVAAA
ncbi:TetR family transcriptional regulator [Solirubrobacter sp. CPCC 204708]|uniref:TetR/AcrR family transcriptional regulator n=1 Tax=Solirubrobacter deserti TaxID=2282478 RepID=A0ABT4RDA3_9ACTN|nr:TetR/AcrR family transcriptional regulator [Solirubrobacter deserti]MBE2314514.1 TetR family transcriptional regulator [Solirubrobacter deserti]MDA0136519.1 TetR/AcrR family transcriptional regulator [Solirubrobacter deserti]